MSRWLMLFWAKLVGISFNITHKMYRGKHTTLTSCTSLDDHYKHANDCALNRHWNSNNSENHKYQDAKLMALTKTKPWRSLFNMFELFNWCRLSFPQHPLFLSSPNFLQHQSYFQVLLVWNTFAFYGLAHGIET